MEPIKISQLVAELENNSEKSAHELGEAKATMIVNFGSRAADRQRPVVINDDDTLLTMLIKVVDHYENLLKAVLTP